MMQIVGGRAGALALLMTLLVALSSGAGRAADLSHAPYYTPEGPLSSFSWIGPYLGGNLGYEWGSTSNNPTRPSGIAGGIQGGYNWQSGQFVFGAEADIQLAAANDTFAPWKFSNPWFGTVRGRAGYAIGSLLLYGTAGPRVRRALRPDFRAGVGEPYQSRLDGRRRGRGGPLRQMVRQSRVSVRRSRQQHVCHHGGQQRPLRQHIPRRRELSFLIGGRMSEIRRQSSDERCKSDI